jgi:hypothetical protein
MLKRPLTLILSDQHVFLTSTLKVGEIISTFTVVKQFITVFNSVKLGSIILLTINSNYYVIKENRSNLQQAGRKGGILIKPLPGNGIMG